MGEAYNGSRTLRTLLSSLMNPLQMLVEGFPHNPVAHKCVSWNHGDTCSSWEENHLHCFFWQRKWSTLFVTCPPIAALPLFLPFSFLSFLPSSSLPSASPVFPMPAWKTDGPIRLAVLCKTFPVVPPTVHLSLILVRDSYCAMVQDHFLLTLYLADVCMLTNLFYYSFVTMS